MSTDFLLEPVEAVRIGRIGPYGIDSDPLDELHLFLHLPLGSAQYELDLEQAQKLYRALQSILEPPEK